MAEHAEPSMACSVRSEAGLWNCHLLGMHPLQCPFVQWLDPPVFARLLVHNTFLL